MKSSHVLLFLFLAFVVGCVIGGTSGFVIGLSSNRFFQKMIEGAMTAEVDADVAHPKRYQRGRFELEFPGNWKLLNDPADDYDPDSYFSIDSPSSNYCLVFVYQVEIDTQVAVEEQLEHYRKLYSSAVETSFQRWGAYQGQGVELTGKLFGTPGGVRVFSHSGEDHGFTIVECFDKSTLSMTRPGFRLIEGSFKIVSPNLPDEAMAALPEIGPRREDHYLHPRQEELLNQAKRLAAIPGSLGRPYFDSDGRLVAVGPREIRAVSKGANQAELLHQCEDWFYNRSAAHLGDRCFYTTSSGAVFEVLDDHSDAEPAGFDAALIAPLDDRRILLVRNKQKPFVPGFDRPLSSNVSQLLTRDDDGNESDLKEIDVWRIDQLCADQDGQHVLVAGVRATNDMDASTMLQMISLEDQQVRELPDWQSVVALGRAHDGWLVSGTPPQGAPGIYRLEHGGKLELLVSGSNLIGILLDEETLLFATQVKLASDPADPYDNVIYQVPIRVVEKHGKDFMPWRPALVNRLADRVVARFVDGTPASTPFGDLEHYEKWARYAKEEIQSMIGQELPLSPKYFDQVLASMQYEPLQHDAVLLLALMLSETLKSQGATLVPSESTDISLIADVDYSKFHNNLVVAYNPVEMVRSTLYDADGWYDPAETIQNEANGRKVLLGIDAVAMKNRCLEEVLEIDPVLRTLDAGKISSTLAATPDNLYLRGRVYSQLADQSQWALIVEIARQASNHGSNSLVDRKASVAARLALQPEGDQLSEIIGILNETLTDHPHETDLYLLLGQAYERHGGENLIKGRACYQRTLDLGIYGDSRSYVVEALQRIDEQIGANQ